ncbi:MAG: metallopeptidase TldD-related protein, partial [Candidatus Latescibacterota bacterium]
QNRSFLADKNNTQIANPLLTLTDDPLKIRGLASRHYDSEGISAKQLPIIEKGVLKNFYVDTYYGRKLNWSPTTGRSSNITFALGNQNLTQLIADVAQGFYITSWLGGNADSTTGDFSFGFRGHQISNGQLTMPVSEMNVTGNFITLLNNLVAVGNDPNPYSSMQTPTLVFENVEFSGK